MLYVFELFDMMKYKSVPYVTLRSKAVSSNSNELDFSSTGIIYLINYFLLQILLFFYSFVRSYLQFSVFGSVMTIGAMLGATFSGKIADLLGRRWVFSAKPLYMSRSI